jgi:hypothetical protein
MEINRQNVAFDHFQVRCRGKLHAELRGQDAIKLNSDHAASAREQQGSDLAASGTDLKHGVLR